MRRAARWLFVAALRLASLSPAMASGKTKVEWSKVDVPEGQDAARHARVLKQALAQAAKKASFGKAKSVTLSARLVELTTERRGDVLRVTCAVMGRAGGQSARSRISFGGSPASRDDLEKQVITMVANGLVARLAQIVRAQSAKAAPPAPKTLP
jgi:hypothetical protein